MIIFKIRWVTFILSFIAGGAFPTEYRFTGQRLDGLGLYQMGVRWYDPALGRWISADTLVPDPGSPQSFNRYMFVLGNPLRFVDPTGMFTEEELVGWGAYTWEEIEALRGSAWYAILMEAQLGDSVYFGNGIDYYTGPMGMGTFHLYEDTLYVGGDVSLWNQDRGGYDSHKVWDSAQQWGELFELASLRPDSYGLIPLPEGSDYTVLNGGFVFPGVSPPLGGAASLIKDRNGNWYLAVGGGIGEAVPASVNISKGFLTDSETAVEEFLSGWACNVNMGYVYGVGYSWPLGDITKPGAIEIGIYSPQFGLSCMYTFRVWPR